MPRTTPDGPSIFPECGTTKGYNRHQDRKNKTQACAPCKRAQANYMLQYRHERGINKGRIIPDALIKQHGIKVTA